MATQYDFQLLHSHTNVGKFFPASPVSGELLLVGGKLRPSHVVGTIALVVMGEGCVCAVNVMPS